MSVSLKRIVRKYLRCWEEFLLMIGSVSFLFPFIILAFLEIILLISLTLSVKPPFSYFMVTLIRTISDGRALHYPDHFILLPSAFNTLVMPLTAVLGFFLFGCAVFMMVDYYDGTIKRVGNYISMAIPRATSFIAIGLVFMTCVKGVPYLLSAVAKEMEASFARTLVLSFSSICGFIMEVLLIYSLLFLKLYGGTALNSIAASIRFAFRRFILTSMVVLTIWVIHKPFGYLLSHPNSLALNFSPENILLIIFANVVLSIFTNFFLFSATTYMVLGRRKR